MTAGSVYTHLRPQPVPEVEDLPHWEALREGRLVLSRCDECGFLTQRHEISCRRCGGEDSTWVEVSGRGEIYSFTVVHQTWVPAFACQVPYVLVAVSIEECPESILTTNLVGTFDVAHLKIGLPVRAVGEAMAEWTLLQFALDG
ncbi:Zn-ribbon domain-containing OB-fold protein [Rhodococcus koreensis]